MADWLSSFHSWRRAFRPRPLSPAAWQELAFWGLLCALFFALFHLHGSNQNSFDSIFLWLNDRWSGETAHCALIPFASLAALWLKRRDIAAAPRSPCLPALFLVALAALFHWAGMMAQQPRVSAFAFLLFLWSVPCALYGYSLARHLIFPVGFLLLAIPLNFINSMSSPLRILASRVSAIVLNGFGLHVIQDGAGLYSAEGNAFSFNVAPECSGLHSLLAMTALVGFYAWLTQKSPAKKWVLFLCSIPIAIIANIFRIILVVVVAAIWDQQTAMGLWHDYSGYPIFLIGILLVLLVDRLLNSNPSRIWHSLKTKFFSPAS